MKYICTHCKKFVPARLVVHDRIKDVLMVGPHRKCVGWHKVRTIGREAEVPAWTLERGSLGRMMRERTPEAPERIAQRLREIVAR